MTSTESTMPAPKAPEPPSFTRATMGFLGSTFLTAALMVLVSAL
jgi:hypothetical protein